MDALQADLGLEGDDRPACDGDLADRAGLHAGGDLQDPSPAYGLPLTDRKDLKTRLSRARKEPEADDIFPDRTSGGAGHRVLGDPESRAEEPRMYLDIVLRMKCEGIKAAGVGPSADLEELALIGPEAVEHLNVLKADHEKGDIS